MQALGQARLATSAGSGAGAGTLGYQRRCGRAWSVSPKNEHGRSPWGLRPCLLMLLKRLS